MFAETFLSEADEWAEANPAGRGINWISGLDVGVRGANLAWALLLFRRCPAWSAYRETSLLRLILTHRAYVLDNLEYIGEYSNNHYLANVASVIVMSVALHWAVESEAAVTESARRLADCMEQQVNSEGMHFENSLAYHYFVVEAFAYATLALRTLGRDMPTGFLARLGAMFDVLESLAYPDGTVPFIGDSSDGRFIVTESYFDRPATLSTPTVALRAPLCGPLEPEGGDLSTGQAAGSSAAYPQSGVYVLRSQGIDVAVTCMPSGVHGRGGHRHNDLLSFELALDGVPVIVDPGTYCYGSDPRARMYFRSTKAHNTMTADDMEQNDITPAFNLREDRSVTTVHVWKSSSAEDLLDVSSSALCREPAFVVHRRVFCLDKARGHFSVRDSIEGQGPRKLEWFFHLAPAVDAEVAGAATVRCRGEGPWFDLAFSSSVAPASLHVELIDDWVSRAIHRRDASSKTVRLMAERCRASYRAWCSRCGTGRQPSDPGDSAGAATGASVPPRARSPARVAERAHGAPHSRWLRGALSAWLRTSS